MTRSSLQSARSPCSAPFAAAGHGCARRTPGAGVDSPANSPDGGPPRPSAPASGSRDSPDRSAAWPPASAVAVSVGRRQRNRSVARPLAGVAERALGTPGMSGIPWWVLPARDGDVGREDSAAGVCAGRQSVQEIRGGSVPGNGRPDGGPGRALTKKRLRSSAPSLRSTSHHRNRCRATWRNVSYILSSHNISLCGASSTMSEQASRQARTVGQLW